MFQHQKYTVHELIIGEIVGGEVPASYTLSNNARPLMVNIQSESMLSFCKSLIYLVIYVPRDSGQFVVGLTA